MRKRGGFLPHGAVLESSGEVRLVMAAPDDFGAPISPTEILPRLHDALRAEASAHDLLAIAVCEDVTITPAGQKQTEAVKVLVEHRRGLTVALYLRWRRKLLGGYASSQVIAMSAEPEVRPLWDAVSSRQPPSGAGDAPVV